MRRGRCIENAVFQLPVLTKLFLFFFVVKVVFFKSSNIVMTYES